MTSEWKKAPIIDYVELIGGGTPKTSVAEYWNEDIPWLSVKDFNNDYRYVYSTEKYITEAGLNNSSTKLLQKDDIIISARGTVGELAMIPYPMAFNQSCYGVRATKGMNKVFLYYLLKYSVQRLKQMTHGSVFDTITRDTFANLIVDVPDEITQCRIASILMAIDDKIELNSKINDNLAETLQAIYQHRYSTTNQSANYETLASICSYSKAKVAVSELTLASYYSTENMLPNKAGSVLAASLPPTEQTTRCVTGDVLVSNIRPYFKKIVYCSNDCGCSPDVLCFTPKKPALSAYLYCTLYADHFFDFMMVGSKGAKMPRGDKQQIMTYAVHMPTEQELREFNGIAMPALAQIESLRQENLRLSSLRDTLLPRLISGDIDVSSINL